MRLSHPKLMGAITLLLVLAACGDDDSDYQGLTPASGREVTVAAAEPLATNIMNDLTPAWSTRGDANSVSLTLNHVGTTPPTLLLTMTCARGAVLTVESPLFTSDASEELLRIGAGEVVVGLPVIATAAETPGVTAKGPAFRDLLARITVGRQISLSYGAQTLGPLPPAPHPMISRFTNRCRDYLEPRGS
ncbi:MAG: hypothetical protein ACI9LT_000151 [Pseudoalteromonas distincta]|jgi:hypothetical protein